MPNFINEVKITVHGCQRELHFQNTEDMERWLDAEEPFWRDMNIQSMDNTLKNYFSAQKTFYQTVRNTLNYFKAELAQNQNKNAEQNNKNLITYFNQIDSGTIITSDYDTYPAIVDMAKKK